MSETAAVRVIVVGDDGSDGAAAAIAFVASLAGPLKADVLLVKAYSPLDELGKAKPPVDFSKLEDDARQYLEEVRGAPLRDAGVAVRAVLVENPDAVEVMEQLAYEQSADLVVIGSHGETGWRERILGSVASELPRRLHCPIAIVPAPRA